MTKPEPLLEITGEDLAFLGDEYTKIVTCKNHDCETCPERRQFLDLIFRVEAGRRQLYYQSLPGGGPKWCRNFSVADWLTDVEREVKGV